MNPSSRIFVALDTHKMQAAVEATAPTGCAFKFGLRMIHGLGTPTALTHLLELGATELFCDAKLHDIPNTVSDAVREIARQRVEWTNVMCLGGAKMMAAAVEAANKVADSTGHRTRILGVTILTSHSFEDLVQLGILNDPQLAITGPEAETYKQRLIEARVVTLALLAQEAGLDGVIASPREAAAIRAHCGPDFEIVTPGIRSGNEPPDDQKRTATAAEAIKNGATRLVIGRPILKALDPAAAAKQFMAEVEAALTTTQST
ncbi:MAG: orotidine-5'-phosphate decarboxylase [Candidatus Kerfeldbacteria bacterium]|nr:orotidine-5'-phosphate decarboxylase [Candidatus Kerfeldbacteria bacterium]